MACFSIQYYNQYLRLPVYEVPAKRVNATKSTHTFTSVTKVNDLLEQPSYYALTSSTLNVLALLFAQYLLTIRPNAKKTAAHIRHTATKTPTLTPLVSAVAV